MIQDIKLVIFSLCLQAAIGTMIFTMIAGKVNGKNDNKVPTILSASLSVIGFLAFVLYLGRPSFIFNAISQISHSWLSRELVASLLFIGLAIINVVVQYVKPTDKRFGWAASLVGLINVFSMIKVYTNTSRLSWQSMNTHIDFLATTVILGITILLITHFSDLDLKVKKQFGWIGIVAVTILGLTTVSNYLPHQTILWILVLQIILLIIGAGLLFVPLLTNQEGKTGTGGTVNVSLGAVSLCCGLIIGRYLFYAVLISATGI